MDPPFFGALAPNALFPFIMLNNEEPISVSENELECCQALGVCEYRLYFGIQHVDGDGLGFINGYSPFTDPTVVILDRTWCINF